MAQSMVNFRMDENLKKDMEQVCQEMGLTLTTAFMIFAQKFTKERRIPFEVTADADPFYSKANMGYLKKIITDVAEGKSVLKPHDLIEVDND